MLRTTILLADGGLLHNFSLVIPVYLYTTSLYSHTIVPLPIRLMVSAPDNKVEYIPSLRASPVGYIRW